jgi:integrase
LINEDVLGRLFLCLNPLNFLTSTPDIIPRGSEYILKKPPPLGGFTGGLCIPTQEHGNEFKHTSNAERVFHDPKTDSPWGGDHIIRKRVWMSALKAANITYRNPYQTRHTYSSMLLSSGSNPLWLAQQMGHKDWGMIRKVYGRWISND